MLAAGAHISKHYRELAFMGFVEVIRHLPEILRNFKNCKKEILAFKPDALILVDYPGFNLRMATWAHAQGLKVYYYISPQLWAWHTSRVHKIKRAVRRMFVILPFEQAFYQKFGMEVVYIGHPLAQEIHPQTAEESAGTKGHIALLPGSRRHEVERLLPVMRAVAEQMPDLRFTVAAVPHLPVERYRQILGQTPNVTMVTGDMRSVLQTSEAAIVTSGTATLETALHGVPQIVVYKGSPVSFQIARRLIKVPYISLVNLIMDEPFIPELIQDQCTAPNIRAKLEEILQPPARQRIREGYSRMHQSLIAGGGPAIAAADIIADLFGPKTK